MDKDFLSVSASIRKLNSAMVFARNVRRNIIPIWTSLTIEWNQKQIIRKLMVS
jgi:hypothetical protein